MDELSKILEEKAHKRNPNIFRLNDSRKRLWDLSENGLKKGAYVGFPELHDFYSVKIGSTSYVVAPPASGKSAIGWEFLMNLAEYSGWRMAIFSPETGDATSIYAEILWAKLRKPFLKNDVLNASDDEKRKAMEFVDKHFFILDSGTKDMTLDMAYQAVLDLEEEEGIKIQGVMLDPWTELVYNTMGQRDDVAMGNALTKVRKYSMQYDFHTFIFFHTRAMGLVEDKDASGNRIRYSPPPTMFDVAGGQMASRKGMFIIGLWRPPTQINDEDGNPYEPNTLIIEILKAKPKAVGKVGKVRLYYDAWSTRFYMKDALGNKIFASPSKEHREEVVTESYNQIELEI